MRSTFVLIFLLLIIIDDNEAGKSKHKERGKGREPNSAMKKLKKQLKREIRTKMLPKALKNINKDFETMVVLRIEEALQEHEKGHGSSSDDMLAMFNHVQSRMKTLEEENEALQKRLKRTSEGFERKFEDIYTHLSDNCNCKMKTPAVGTTPSDPKVSSAFRVPEGPPEDNTQKPESSEYVIDRFPPPIKETSEKLSLVDLKEDLTFNVSTDMPEFSDVDTLLAVDDDGFMTRISLNDSSVRGVMKTESFVEGITYDPVSKKIFWGSNRAGHKAVYSVKRDGSALTKLQDGKWAFSLAVDGKRRKLFISEWSTKGVCVMSTNGHNYKMITDYSDDGDPRNIVLDTQRRLIYVSYSFSIVKMKYDGTRIKRLAEGVWMQPLSLDVTGNSLYYSIKRNIYKVDLSAGRSKFVNQLDVDLSTIVFHDDKLYIAYQSWVKPIDVLDLQSNVLTRFADVRSDSLLRLCIIPM